MTDDNSFYAGGLGVDAYDLLLNADAVKDDVAFYLECAREFGEPILELAAGTGRVLVPLAERGHEVVGLDLSRAMLQVAEAKLRARGLAEPRAQLVQGDMTAFDLGRKFALILVPFRAFQHVVEPAAQRAALGCMHRHLKTGGRLVLNIFDPRFDLLVDPQAFVGSKREARDAKGRLVRFSIIGRDVDFMRQTVRERMRIEALDSENVVLQAEESAWTLRWTQRQEMLYLLELSGFDPVAEYSDFQRSPPAYGKEQIWVARRREGQAS